MNGSSCLRSKPIGSSCGSCAAPAVGKDAHQREAMIFSSKGYSRCKLVPLLVIAIGILSQAGITAQFIGKAISNNTLILSSKGLADALSNQRIITILVGGRVVLDEGDFRPTLNLTRNVTITGQTTAANLDFNLAQSILLVAQNVKLAFQNVVLSNTALQTSGNANGDNVIQALSAWPTISGSPGSTFQFQNTTTMYGVPNSYNNCTGFQARTALQLQQLAGAANVKQPSPAAIVVSGVYSVQLPVTSKGVRVGSALYISDNSTYICSGNSVKGSKKSFPWWAGLLIGLGVAAIAVAAIILAAFLCLRRQKTVLTDSYTAEIESVKARASLMTTPTGGEGWTPPPSAQHSGGYNTAVNSRTSSMPGLMPEKNLRQRTLSNPGQRGGSGGSLEDMHSQLLGMKLQHGLDGVEVGPLLGRGSYGSVFKGRWRGTLVAIKVIESGLSDAGDDGSRESLLSASIAHPNVVACFKICLVRSRVADPSNDSGQLQPNSSQCLSDADIAAARAAPGSGAGSLPKPPASPTEALNSNASGPIKGGRDIFSNRAAEQTTPRAVPADAANQTGIVLEVMDSKSDAPTVERLGELQTWMLLEYCDRGSLEQAVQMHRFYKRGTKTLDLASIYRTLLDIAAGVDHLHALGIVHADLKPGNVLLKSTATDSRGFICKLADFGLSRMMIEQHTHVSAATTGTVPYMPPEMLQKHRMTKAIDIYSFGIIMNQLFTEETPFAGMTMPAILMGVVKEGLRPDTSDNQPPAFAALRDRCWDVDMNNRPSIQTVMGELLEQSRAPAAPAQATVRKSASGPPASPFMQQTTHVTAQQPHQQQQHQVAPPTSSAAILPTAVAADTPQPDSTACLSAQSNRDLPVKRISSQTPKETIQLQDSALLTELSLAMPPSSHRSSLDVSHTALQEQHPAPVAGGMSGSPFGVGNVPGTLHTPSATEWSGADNQQGTRRRSAPDMAREAYPGDDTMSSEQQDTIAKQSSGGDPSMWKMSMRRSSSSNGIFEMPGPHSNSSTAARAPVAAPRETGSPSNESFRPLLLKSSSQRGTIRYSLDTGSRLVSARSTSLRLNDRRSALLPSGNKEQFVPLDSTAEGNQDSKNRVESSSASFPTLSGSSASSAHPVIRLSE